MLKASEKKFGVLAGVMLLAAAMCGTGCAERSGPVEPPPYPSIFDRNYGLAATVAPPTITPGATTYITVSARPNFTGTGYFTLEGGSVSDTLMSPVVLPLPSSTNWRVDFAAGETRSVTWAVEFGEGVNPAYLAFVAWMDSLDLDGVRYPTDSLDVRTRIGSDILTVLYREIQFPR